MSENTIPVEPTVLTAADLLKLGFEEDPLLLEDMSLCTVCSYTCTTTSAQN
jgi:hypothetical protein